MSATRTRKRRRSEALVLRLRIPSRSRPGLLHEVTLRSTPSSLTTACSCEDSCFGGPEKRGEPWCRHTAEAVEIAAEEIGVHHAVPEFDPETGELTSSEAAGVSSPAPVPPASAHAPVQHPAAGTGPAAGGPSENPAAGTGARAQDRFPRRAGVGGLPPASEALEAFLAERAAWNELYGKARGAPVRHHHADGTVSVLYPKPESVPPMPVASPEVMAELEARTAAIFARHGA